MSTVVNSGCLVFLIDESAAMNVVMGDVVADGRPSTKPNSERVATALNSLLQQISNGPDFDVALVGYQIDSAGNVNVGSRWAGALSGRDFVRTSELAAAPLRVESRTRKIPAPGGIGIAREESISFPIWYEPALGVKAPQIAAFDYCRNLLARHAGGPAVVCHIFSGSSADGNPQMTIGRLLEMVTPDGLPLVLQVHLAGNAQVVTAAFPSNPAYLTQGSSRDLFRRASILPTHLITAIKNSKVAINPGARGMIYNAKIADIIRIFGLIKTHTKAWSGSAGVDTQSSLAAEIAQPQAATSPVVPPSGAAPGAAPILPVASSATPVTEPLVAEAVIAEPTATAATTPSGERVAFIALVLDRSLDEPFSGNMQNPFAKLQDHANDLLRQISKLKDEAVDVAMISYGRDPQGQLEVRSSFDGPLAGQTIVRNSALADGAIRVEEVEEQVSNGIGGLISRVRKKPIYFELEPTAAASPNDAFAVANQYVTDWTALHQTARVAPIVLHLTRGQCDSSAMELVAGQLNQVHTGAGSALLYHLIATESPHKSLAYPDNEADMSDSALQKLWELSSPLLGREELSAEKPAVKQGSKGFVVNGQFDLLLDGVKRALVG